MRCIVERRGAAEAVVHAEVMLVGLVRIDRVVRRGGFVGRPAGSFKDRRRRRDEPGPCAGQSPPGPLHRREILKRELEVDVLALSAVIAKDSPFVRADDCDGDLRRRGIILAGAGDGGRSTKPTKAIDLSSVICVSPSSATNRPWPPVYYRGSPGAFVVGRALDGLQVSALSAVSSLSLARAHVPSRLESQTPKQGDPQSTRW